VGSDELRKQELSLEQLYREEKGEGADWHFEYNRYAS